MHDHSTPNIDPSFTDWENPEVTRDNRINKMNFYVADVGFTAFYAIPVFSVTPAVMFWIDQGFLIRINDK